MSQTHDTSPEVMDELQFAVDLAGLEALASQVLAAAPVGPVVGEGEFWEWWRRYDVLKPAADGACAWVPPMFRVPTFEQMWADA